MGFIAQRVKARRNQPSLPVCEFVGPRLRGLHRRSHAIVVHSVGSYTLFFNSIKEIY